MNARKISFWALTLLIISAVESNRNLPASAIFGAPLIFFFLFTAVFFLLPSALVAAELSAAFPEEGGIYHWVRSAFGKNMGMLAVWLQWINTLVWYPTILSFLAGTLAYFLEPAWMQSKLYMLSAISLIFWGMTWVNLRGISVSVRFNTVCAAAGTLFPLLFLIGLGVYWIAQGRPLQISFSPKEILPALNQLDTWTALEAVIGSFVGMELSGVHVNHVPHPQKTFPRALFTAAAYICLTMLFGSLAVAIVLPKDQINLAGGLMQVFGAFFTAFGLQWLTPLMTGLIVLGVLGNMVNWLISPAKGLLQTAEHGFLPPFFKKVNAQGVPSRILLLQAAAVTVFCLLLFSLPSINAFYWFLTALSNCLYMGMYILMFLAVYFLRPKMAQKAFRVPGGMWGLGITSLFGIFGALLTLIFGFFPPSAVNVGSPLRYTLMLAFGNLALLTPFFLLTIYRKKS